MKIKVRCFGQVAEIVGQDHFEIEAAPNSDDLLQEVLKVYPSLENMSWRLAVNHHLVNNRTELTLEDELAILPPFAGG